MNKKFNIKKLVKVSAVALAMISAGGIASTVNANTNVHADDSVNYAAVERIANQQVAQDDKDRQAMWARNNKKNAYTANPVALNDIESSGHLSKDQADNPAIRSYLNKHGYNDAQINRAYHSYKKFVAEDDKGSDDSWAKHLTNKELNDPSKATLHAMDVADGDIAPSHKAVSNKSIKKAVASHHGTKRIHLSKAMIRKIMKQIRADKKAIRHDNHYLSTRNGKKFTKLMNHSKHAQKRAMHVKGAKRYAYYYKDEAKHEKDMVRLTKSIKITKTSKISKHHARKPLIRKNHKSHKRAKRVAHHHYHHRK